MALSRLSPSIDDNSLTAFCSGLLSSSSSSSSYFNPHHPHENIALVALRLGARRATSGYCWPRKSLLQAPSLVSHHHVPVSQLPSVELETIANEEQFESALAQAQQTSKPIIVDWMAAWCRKCIYLKPKLEKLASEFQPDVKFYCVDVNTVPQTLVKRADVTKMPTIQLWKDGEKQDEVIAGQKAWLVVDEVRDMLENHLK